MLAHRWLRGAPYPTPAPPTPVFDPSVGEHLTKQGVVIAKGAGGSWNSDLVESPHIAWDASIGLYRMVATGYNGTTEALGVWTSPDLSTWTPYGGNPFFGPSGSGSDAGGVSGPCVWQEAGTYYLFYIGFLWSGYEAGPASYICLATSTDWIPGTNSGTWTRRGAVISPDAGASWRNAHIYHPQVVKKGSTYYLFFNASGSHESIGYATSSDLLTWTVDDVNSPIVDAVPGTWCATWVGDPFVYLAGTTWCMAYYGDNLGYGAYDGLTFCDDADFPVGPWTEYGSNPVLAPGSAGSIDDTFAHKPCIVVRGNTYYHFYTAVGSSSGRQIALATETF